MDADRIDIRPARVPGDMARVRALFLEYARALDFSLCFQGFDEELAALPGCYAAPRGTIVLGWAGGAAAGVVAVRPLAADICEMKRLYVRPGARARGLGRRLAAAAVAAGAAMGYRAMRLDTHDSMAPAMALYRRLGFREIPAYYDNPLENVRYFERSLIAAAV